MKTFLITYDLIRPEIRPEYSKLYDMIKSYVYWAKPLESVWLIKTDQGREQVFNNIRAVTDFNDKLLIIEVTNDWIGFNLPEGAVQWMQGGL